MDWRPEGMQRRGRPRSIGRDQVLLDLKRMGVKDWKNKCQDKDKWKDICLDKESIHQIKENITV